MSDRPETTTTARIGRAIGTAVLWATVATLAWSALTTTSTALRVTAWTLAGVLTIIVTVHSSRIGEDR